MSREDLRLRTTFRLLDRDGVEVALQNLLTRLDDRQVQITYPALGHGQHRLVIDETSIRDRLGNALGTGSHTLSFGVGDDTAPQITGFSPVQGGSAEQGTTTLRLTFSEPIADSFDADTFRLFNSQDKPVDIENVLRSPNNRITVTVAALSVDGYRLVVDSTEIRDLAGNRLGQEPVEWQFSIVDSIAPSVVSTTPTANARLGVGLTQAIVQFSEPMDPATLNPNTVGLFTRNDEPIATTDLVLNETQTEVTITFASLQPELYVLRLRADMIRDSHGNALGDVPFTVPFEIADKILVTTTSDSGPGSLRAAMETVHLTTGLVYIEFAIPDTDPNFIDVDSGSTGGDAARDVFVISLLSALPPINNANASIVIDGSTQAHLTGNTNSQGPEIVLDGSGAGSGIDGLTILSSNNRILGLNIQRFSGSGIAITGGDHNVVVGNSIGTDATGALGRANGGDGVRLANGARSNRIGSNFDGINDADETNIIAFNAGRAITVLGADSTGNSLRRNTIHSNVGTPAVDLGGDGFTANDPLDADLGPNRLQNRPELAFGILSSGFVRVLGWLSSAPLQTYQIDLYRTYNSLNPTANAGNWIGATTVTTGANGIGSFNPILGVSIAVGDGIAAVATDSMGNTSEFGFSAMVSAPSPLEPNDAINAANDSGLSHATPGYYQTSGSLGNGNPFVASGLDVDMLKVQLDADDRLTVDVDTLFAGLEDADSVLRLFNASGEQLAISDNSPAPGEAPGIHPYLDFIAPSTGDYYIGISGRGNSTYNPLVAQSGQIGEFGTYFLMATVFTPGEIDRNDTLETAIETNLTSDNRGPFEIDAAIGDNRVGHPLLDVELYRFQMNAGHRVKIDLDAAVLVPASTPNSYLRLFDAAGNEVASNYDDGSTTDSYLDYEAMEDGVYYVGVSGEGNYSCDPNVESSGSDGYGSAGTYHLEIQIVSPLDDELEPNDSFETAIVTGINGAPGSYWVDSLIGVSDIDFFRLELAPGQSIEVQVLWFDSNIRIFDESGFVVAEDLETGTLTFTSTSSQLGSYYVAISSAFGGTGSYSLYIQTLDLGDALEPNDSLASAIATGLNGVPGIYVADSRISSESDDDYFRVDVAAGQNLHVRVEGFGNASVWLFNGDGTVRSGSYDRGGFTTLTIDPGIYFVVFRRRSDGTGGPYRLWIELF